MKTTRHDIVVIGSGPAGQKAAIQAAKCGRNVAIVERLRDLGGECVHRGTIPSKALRECALQLRQAQAHSEALNVGLRSHVEMDSLLGKVDSIIESHVDFTTKQMARNGITHYHGKASFVGEHEVQVQGVVGEPTLLQADWIVVATGSRPRLPPGIPVDHEHVLDSDSILSLTYLPESLTVLGAGVIASEYASIFALLGVDVTIIDKGDRPLAFMDPELSDCFVESFESHGGKYLAGRDIEEVSYDGFSKVATKLGGGEVIETEKVLVALGRTPNLDGLNVESIGLSPDGRGRLPVDDLGRTALRHVLAVGDVAGGGLASQAMVAGRRAVRHALGLEPGPGPEATPCGIFTIPEMACVGLTEAQVSDQHGGAVVGRAHFSELARAQISGCKEGLLKLVADASGDKLLGVHAVGEGSTELVHVGQMAMSVGASVDTFVDQIFNFPTMAESYRVAALDIMNRRSRDRAVTPEAVAST